MKSILQSIKSDLASHANPDRAQISMSFFKTKKGQYGHGDIFMGVTVPATRTVAKKYSDVSLDVLKRLLSSPIHEERLLALIIMVDQYQKGDREIQTQIAMLYIDNVDRVNNWDLVDVSADKIIGAYTETSGTTLLYEFARSHDLWKKRIAMVATYYYIKKGSADVAIEIATILKDDTHDLIQKAVGWMLREVGKRCSQDIEEHFLMQYAHSLPRTTLRYSIERFSPQKKRYYMNVKNC